MVILKFDQRYSERYLRLNVRFYASRYEKSNRRVYYFSYNEMELILFKIILLEAV